MLAVILMGLLTSENPSEAEIRIFTKPRFTIIHGQLQIALESYAYRLAMENIFLNHSTLRNAFLKLFHRWFQIYLISTILYEDINQCRILHVQSENGMAMRISFKGELARSQFLVKSGYKLANFDYIRNFFFFFLVFSVI